MSASSEKALGIRRYLILLRPDEHLGQAHVGMLLGVCEDRWRALWLKLE